MVVEEAVKWSPVARRIIVRRRERRLLIRILVSILLIVFGVIPEVVATGGFVVSPTLRVVTDSTVFFTVRLRMIWRSLTRSAWRLARPARETPLATTSRNSRSFTKELL